MRPRVEDEVRRNLFFFEAVLFDAVPAVLDEIEHDARRPARAAGARPTARWTGGDMDGHPEVGADTLARALQLHRSTALRLLRDARRPAGADASRTPSLRIPVSRGARGVARRATRAELPERRRAAAPAPRVGAAADQARLRRAPADQHAAPARARARLRRRAGAARATSSSCSPHLGSRHVALRLDPAAAVAGRRLRLPPRRDRHPPGRERPARGDVARCCPATPTPTRSAPPGAADRGAGAPAGAGSSTTRAARRASCCACSTRSRCPPRPTGRRRCRRS